MRISNIGLSKFNSMKIYVKKDKIDEFSRETEKLIEKYSIQEGDAYQLTTFLVPEVEV